MNAMATVKKNYKKKKIKQWGKKWEPKSLNTKF